MKTVDLLVIGGGSAGMAAAVSAYDCGVRNVMIIERSDQLGGILCQCIHNGFGVHRYHEELTGPEYAQRSAAEVQKREITCLLHAFVIDVSKERVVTVVHPQEGVFRVQAKALVLATGCRERARGALMIPGTRPAGVITAGSAQRYLNLKGYLPGKEAVILGSGDIGLIMARQFALEGIRVKEVVELMPYSSGLRRNISQCLDDFNIPLSLSSTVVEIRGRERVSSVVVAKVGPDRKPIQGTEREIACDTLVISAGLIPENELGKMAGVQMSRSTKGPVVDDCLQTSLEGVFACGNALHVHDLVDHVSEEGERAGKYAAEYVQNKVTAEEAIPVHEGFGVGGLIPQYVKKHGGSETISFVFRPRVRIANAVVTVFADKECAAKRSVSILTPGETCEIVVRREKLRQAAGIEIAAEGPDGKRA